MSNMDKYISLSKTSGFNENININYINNINSDFKQLNDNNNENIIFKKARCSTLNSHHMNNHPKLLKDNIEENKNNTMETNKRFYNNNDNYIINLKGISRKNKSLNNKNFKIHIKESNKKKSKY